MLTKSRILVVSDDRSTVTQSLATAEYDVVTADNLNSAMASLDSPLDLMICDLGPRECECMTLLDKWKAVRPEMPFLLLAGPDEVPAAIAAMKMGAADYLLKPVNGEELQIRVDKWIEASRKEVRLHELESQLENGTHATSGNGGGGIDIPAGTSLEALERAAVEKALQEHRGNRTHAAKTLGISVRTLQRKLKAWRMPMFAVPAQSTNRYSVPSMR